MGRKESGLKSPWEMRRLMAAPLLVEAASAACGWMNRDVERARIGVVPVMIDDDDDDGVVVCEVGEEQSLSRMMAPSRCCCSFESYASHPIWLQWNGSNAATATDDEY